MARVTEIAVARLRRTLRRPFVTSLRSTTTVSSLLVRLRDEDGCAGYGEAPEVWRVTGESVTGARECALGPLADALRSAGGRIDEPETLSSTLASAVVGNGGARAAVEVAANDLLARRLGQTLVARLGGATASRVSTDLTLAATGEFPEADELRGFGTLKVKVGIDPGDIERVLRLRDRAEHGLRFRVDANQAWSLESAVHAVEVWQAEGLALEFLEQPLPAHDLAGHAELRRRVDVPIMLDESVFTADGLRRAADLASLDLVNIKLAKCGGLYAGLELADLAAEREVRPLVGSMMESAVGVSAAAALAATIAPGRTHDLDAAWWVRPRRDEPPRYLDGHYVIGEGTGLTEATDHVTRGLRWTRRALA